MAHEHICPEVDCGKTWSCHEEGRVWDQEDSDCRWFTRMRCPDCVKKFTMYNEQGKPYDLHSLAAKHLFGLEGEPTVDQRNAAKNSLYLHLYSNPNPYASVELKILKSRKPTMNNMYCMGRRKWYHANWILQIWDFFGGPRLLRLFQPKFDIKPIPTFQDLDFVDFMNSCRDKIAKATGVSPESISPTGRINRSTAQKLLEDKK